MTVGLYCTVKKTLEECYDRMKYVLCCKSKFHIPFGYEVSVRLRSSYGPKTSDRTTSHPANSFLSRNTSDTLNKVVSLGNNLKCILSLGPGSHKYRSMYSCENPTSSAADRKSISKASLQGRKSDIPGLFSRIPTPRGSIHKQGIVGTGFCSYFLFVGQGAQVLLPNCGPSPYGTLSTDPGRATNVRCSSWNR